MCVCVCRRRATALAERISAFIEQRLALEAAAALELEGEEEEGEGGELEGGEEEEDDEGLEGQQQGARLVPHGRVSERQSCVPGGSLGLPSTSDWTDCAAWASHCAAGRRADPRAPPRL